MKSRKLISLLSATAMSVSAFSGLALTASAAELFTYDGSTTTGWTAGSGDSERSLTTVSDANGEYTQFTINDKGSSTYTWTYDLPDGAKLADNYVIEYDVMMHQSNGMTRLERYNQVAFISSDAATDTRNFVAYATAYNDEHGGGANAGADAGTGYTTGVASSVSSIYGMASAQINATNDTPLALSDDASGIVSDKWYRVQTAVSGTTATVNVIDAEGTKIVDNAAYINSASALDSIFVTVGRGDASVTGQGIVALDNIKIYDGTAEALTTDGLRGEVEIETPATAPPTAAPVAAPSITMPEENAVAGISENFNSAAVGTLIQVGTTAQEPYTGINGMSIAIGARDSGADATTYASVSENVASDNVLNLVSGRFSNRGTGPALILNDNLALTADSTEASVMAFAVKLSSTGTDGEGNSIPGRMYLLDNKTNVDGNNVARDIMAVLTTEDDASGYVNGDDDIGISVEPNEWYTVVVTVTPNSEGTVYGTGKVASTYRVFVYDSTGTSLTGSAKDAVVVAEKVNSGANAVSVNNLPVIVTANMRDALGNGCSSTGMIDNLITYKTTSTEYEPGKALPVIGAASEPEEPEVTATPAPVVDMDVDEETETVTLTSDVNTSAVLVQASYVTDGTLDSIKVVPVTLTADTADVSTVEDGDLDAFQTNDKFMVVDSLDSMRPLSIAYTVTGGAEQTTPAPIPTVEATTEPTEAASAEPTEVASAEPTEVASAEPTEDADITLVHTGYVTSGSSMGTAGVSIDTADGNELFNSWGGGSASAYGQVAYAQFTIGDDVPTEGVASLDFTVTITGAADDSNARTTSVYLMPDTFPSLDEIGDDTTVTAQGTLLGNIEGTVGEATAYTFKITDQTTIETILGQDKVILGVTDRGKGGSMAGINSTTPPTLTLVEGEQVTLTTKVGGTATAGITVKIDGVEYTSDDNGVISLLLPVGDHTYEVEAGVYEAIAATSFTVATETGYTGDINLTESSVTVVADREVPGGVTSLYEWPTTTERGESTILYPTVTRVNFSEQTEETYTDFTLDFDICVLDGQAVSMGAQKANNLGTMLSFSGANGVLTLNAVESTSSSKAIAPAEGNLATGTWYNVKAEYTTVDNVTNGITVTVSSVDEAGTVGAQVAQLSGIATRNNDKGAYDNVNFNEVTGAPMLNNIYVYKTAAAAE